MKKATNDLHRLRIRLPLMLITYWYHDVTALFTNVPARETITILVERAFSDNWFNDTSDLNLTKDQLREVLELATTNQLFQLNGTLYEQVEGVAMSSPLGPLLANTFMCSIEEHIVSRSLSVCSVLSLQTVIRNSCKCLERVRIIHR